MFRTFNVFSGLAIFVACLFAWYRMDYWLQEYYCRIGMAQTILSSVAPWFC